MTVSQALATGRERLRPCGDAGRFDASRLLAETLQRGTAWLLAHGEDELDGALRALYEAALARRAMGEPVAYIVGSAGFYGRAFEVTPDVLIPRPESERLVELACAYVRARELAAPQLCDVGTGSGVLAVTLACELPGASVTGRDVSPAALDVARRNARTHGVEARIRFALGDALAGDAPAAPYDCIVANLPYVRTADLKARPDPTSFEPALALDGGYDGLAAYRRCLMQARPLLAPDAALFLEAGPDTATALAALAALAFPHMTARIRIDLDLAGHERIVAVRIAA